MATSTRRLRADQITAVDAEHLWHPYGAFPASTTPLVVQSAHGTRLTLADGRELIDGMSSWWAAVHGYRHPVLDAAAADQLGRMSHVMFGGLTHEPAAALAELLVRITPAGLDKVFLADSGSVSVEVAVKMCLQYWRSRGKPAKHRLLTWRGGYHGDTFAPMSVCDPDGGMHSLWTDVLAEQVFAPIPPRDFDRAYVAEFERLIVRHRDELAAVIVEPIVQGAGGMRFHHPDYLRELRRLCDKHGLLLVFDEIATGFGRTGELFAADHVGVSPDIMCVGKALTGGYLTLAATLCTGAVAEVISAGEAGGLMHGPTFMGNPLACAVAVAAVELLLSRDWKSEVNALTEGLRRGLEPARAVPGVVDVRVLGGIGVIELAQPVDLRTATDAAVAAGVWLRPFRNLIYAMPPYVCTAEDLTRITAAMVATARGQAHADLAPADPPPNPTAGVLNTVQVSCRSMEAERASLSWLDDVERERRAAGLRRELRPRTPATGLIDLASNDYLGLVRHPEVIDGAIAAVRRWGGGATGSRLVTGSTTEHELLERELAEFVGAESGLVFASGYAANLGAVTALSGKGALIVSDEGSHASLVDACRLSRSRVEVAPHGDVDFVRRALSTRSEARALVLTDSVFSADGDLAPLRELHRVCREHDALLLVDEAHGIGVRGSGGQGLVHELGLAGEPDLVVTATLSKSLASQGGAVLAAEKVRAHLIDAARTFIFDTGLAPAAVGAARAALAVLIREPQRAAAVLDRAADLARITGVGAPESAVVSVILGDPQRAFEAAAACRQQGLHVGCFRPPSVPEGTSRLRLTARATIDAAELARIEAILRSVLGRDNATSDSPLRTRGASG